MAKLGTSVAPLAVAVVLFLGTACDTECQEFCTTWFDYQQDMCGVIDTEDARVLCIADYRGHLVADEERDVCTDLVQQVEALRSSTDCATRQSYCDTNTCEPAAESDP
jgi:hypothetical protein